MVAIKGRPKRRKGCLANAERYRAATVLASAVPRNFLEGKTAIVCEERQMGRYWFVCARRRDGMWWVGRGGGCQEGEWFNFGRAR